MPFASQEAAQNTPSSVIPAERASHLEWTVHLWKQRPAASLRIAACFVVTYLCGAVLFRSPLLGLLPAAALILSLSEYWLPIRYRLDDAGATARYGIVTLEIAWPDVRHAYLADDGIKLSPLSIKGTRLESLRGVFLRFGDNREAVVDAVRSLRARSRDDG